MDLSALQSLGLLAILAAMIVTAYELSASLKPVSCPECPHCRELVTERHRRDEELATWYARKHRIDGDDEDDRNVR